jgi:hypothetical protein
LPHLIELKTPALFNHKLFQHSATESNFGFQPEMSRRLPSLRVPNRQGCLFDETGKMPVLQSKGRGETFGRTMRTRHEHVKISVAFSLAPFAAAEPKPNDSVS